MYKNQRKGVTLLEVLFVIGIMAVILGAIYVVLGNTTTRKKSNESRMEFTQLQNAINSIYDGQSEETWIGLNEEVVAKNKLINNKYISKDGGLVNPYGGSVVIYDHEQGAGLSYYQIVFYGIPKQGCIELASNHDWMASGPATQINNYQDNKVTPLDIGFIVKNVCIHDYNMFAWATAHP